MANVELIEEISKCWTMADHERRDCGIDKPTNPTAQDFIEETGDKSAQRQNADRLPL
jgi:hypothetical protein